MARFFSIFLCLGLAACFAAVDEEAWKKDGGNKPRDSEFEPYIGSDAEAVLDADPGGLRWRPVSSGTDKDLNGVWGSSRSDIWAVGDDGMIRHYDGTEWSFAESHTSDNLYDVAGVARADVWAVGSGGTILHYNGIGWSRVAQTATTTDLSGVWPVSMNDVWAVGDSGVILHYDGSTWSKVASPGETDDLRDVWGASANDVWAVGKSGTILHWQGLQWTEQALADSIFLQGVFGAHAQLVWAVGDCEGGKPKGCTSRVYRYTGSTWPRYFAGGGELLRAAWASGPDDLWVVGHGCCGNTSCACARIRHHDGQGWSDHSISKSSETLEAVWGFAADDIWAVGDEGYILHYSLPD